MKLSLPIAACAALALLLPMPAAEKPAAWKNLFNGKNLDGWVNVNTDKATWSVKNGEIVCTGHPIGIMRTDREYENFILHVEWKHIEPGGNSGVFGWSEAKPDPETRLPNGIEIQMLELDFINLHAQNGKPLPDAYVHGELFGVGGVTIVPDNPRGPRSKSVENRCLGRGQWNTYDVVAVDGSMRLAVNGKFVNGFTKASRRKGYLCLESEGAEIHFRNIRILELPPGNTAGGVQTPQQ